MKLIMIHYTNRGFVVLHSLMSAVMTVLTAYGTEIRIEAEAGSVIAPMVVEMNPQASEGAYIYTPESYGNRLDLTSENGRVELSFEVVEEGDYELWGKVFTPGKPRMREDSFFVTVDGQEYTWFVHDWADNWVWRPFLPEKRTGFVKFHLSKGSHTLVISQRVAGTLLDQLKWVSGSSDDPFAPDPKDYVSSGVAVYEDLSPYFDMPDLRVPVFPDRDFNIVDYGAVAGSKSTQAIQDAINACHAAGGGRVIIPEGEWLTGSIHLKSFVNLHVSEGAVLKFSQELEDYLPVVFTRWEGMECYNYSAPIYANGLRNIAITGSGTIDGQGEFWWDWKKDRQGKTAARLYNMIVEGVPPSERVLGTPEDGMRPNFIQFISCQGILVENVTLKNGPMWTLHPVYCTDMIVRGIKVETVGPNNDGIDPDSTRNLLIEDCYFSTGDDCVVLKSGLNEDGWRVAQPTENVVIRNIYAHEGHGGVVIGSEMSGGIRNIYAHNCIFVGTDRGIRVKSMRGRGGVVENLWVEDIQMKNMGAQAIRLNMFYGSSTVKPATDVPAVFRNFHIRNIECDGAARAVEITGLPELAIEGIHLENLEIRSNEGIKITDGKNISIRNLNLSTQQGTPIELDRVREFELDGARIRSGQLPWIDITGEDSGDIQIHGLLDGNEVDARVQSHLGSNRYRID